MSDFARAHADLQDAIQRRDTRSIHASQQAVRKAMTAQLRADVDERKRRAEAKRERSRRPFWWPLGRRR